MPGRTEVRKKVRRPVQGLRYRLIDLTRASIDDSLVTIADSLNG